jgi:hypothetical protein
MGFILSRKSQKLLILPKLLGNPERQNVPPLSNVPKLMNSFSFVIFAKQTLYEPSERIRHSLCFC